MTENDLEKKMTKFFSILRPCPPPREIHKIDYKDRYSMSLATLKLNFKKIRWNMWFARLLKTNVQKSDEIFFGHLTPPKRGNVAKSIESDLAHAAGYPEIEFQENWAKDVVHTASQTQIP